MSPAFRNALLWIVASATMVVACLSSASAAYVDGHYVPDNEDAFYHARRILDSVLTHAPVMQFDPKIHVPEGSWITWPWGFDTLMADITSAFGPFADVDHANRVLMNIPPVASIAAVLLILVLARQVKLPMLHTIVFALGFALLPAAFRAFSVGNVDHHFVELLCTLGTFTAGVAFFREDNRSPIAPLVLGGLLGFAVALQNGLFILQLPVCLMLGLRWVRGAPLPERKHMRIFAATLAVTTLLACLPSQPFRHGFFEFYTLSVFHLYIAIVVGVFSILLSQLAFSGRNLVIVCALAIVAMLPLGGMLYLAGAFVTGSLDTIANISEAKSPYQLFIERGESESTMYMSWLLLFMFPMMLVNLWWAWRRSDPLLQFVAVMSVFGLAFFQFQYRFNVFGLVPMLLTPLLVAKELAVARPALGRVVSVTTVALFALAYLPTRGAWQTTWALASHLSYANIRSTWPRLEQLCNERPGVVLADVEAGHWVRYHTSCSVIANVFLLTPQHAAKLAENESLMLLTPAELLKQRNDLRYVLVFHELIIRNNPDGAEVPVLELLRPQMLPLERELLGPDADIPPQFAKRWEVRSPQGQIYSRLYEIVRD
jgi:hypothetical protein